MTLNIIQVLLASCTQTEATTHYGSLSPMIDSSASAQASLPRDTNTPPPPYLQHLPVVSVVLRPKVQEGKYPRWADVGHRQAGLGEGGEGGRLLCGVLAAVGTLSLKLQEPS